MSTIKYVVKCRDFSGFVKLCGDKIKVDDQWGGWEPNGNRMRS